MKQIVTLSLVALVGIAIGLFLSGCASTRIRKLSGEAFLNKAKQIEQVSSFHWTTYIGSSRKRAYLEFGCPSLMYNIIGKEIRTTVFWTDLSELPKDIADQLRTGTPPWKPWLTETNGTERAIEFTLPK